MLEINIESDLVSVNDQISKLVEELNKVNSAKDTIIQQIQNLNGVAMYLRGKQQPEEGDTLERTEEYPEPIS